MTNCPSEHTHIWSHSVCFLVCCGGIPEHQTTDSHSGEHCVEEWDQTWTNSSEGSLCVCVYVCVCVDTDFFPMIQLIMIDLLTDVAFAPWRSVVVVVWALQAGGQLYNTSPCWGMDWTDRQTWETRTPHPVSSCSLSPVKRWDYTSLSTEKFVGLKHYTPVA